MVRRRIDTEPIRRALAHLEMARRDLRRAVDEIERTGVDAQLHVLQPVQLAEEATDAAGETVQRFIREVER